MGGFTPLMNAAGAGNAEMASVLLAHGADVNTVSSARLPHLKNGPLGVGSFTALSVGAAYGGPDNVKVLLDHGAKVNAADVRGLTPLMMAIATDRSDARTVRALLAKGADRSIKSVSGETAVDWERRFQNIPSEAGLVDIGGIVSTLTAQVPAAPP
jgi:ankyrin repeat protein